MRIKHFDYVAKGAEINLTNDEVSMLRCFVELYFDKVDAGETDSVLMSRFGKRLLNRLPKDKN